MNHLTIRQAVIQSRYSSIGLLARNARNLGRLQGFEVLNSSCHDENLSSFQDGNAWFKTLQIEDLAQAEGFTSLDNSCRYQIIKSFWP